MRRSFAGHFGAAILLLGIWGSSSAQAQNYTTWVSPTGDDANPCSATSACRTFMGALMKTPAGGVVVCQGPGSYGQVTITRSVTISCPSGGSGLRASGNGIVVRAGPDDEVFIRGIEVIGTSSSGHGISFVSGGSLHVEDVLISRFNSNGSFGIAFQPTAASSLFVTNTTIVNNGGSTAGGGVLIQAAGAGDGARVHLVGVRLQNNGLYGVRIDANERYPVGVLAEIEDSQIVGSTTGVSILTAANTGTAAVMVNGSMIASNGTGLLADGNRAVMRVARSTITNNQTGITARNGGTIGSYFNNMLDGNGTNGAFTQRISPEISAD